MARIDVDEIMSVEDEKLRFQKAKDSFSKARLALSGEIRLFLDEHGISQLDAAEIANVTPSALNKILKKEFSLPTQSIAPFAFQIMRTSCHKLFFGQDLPTMMPKVLSYLVRELSDMEDTEREPFYSELEQLYIRDEEKKSLATDKSCPELLRDRVLEAASDRFIFPSHLCGRLTDMSIKVSLRKIEATEYPEFACSVPTIMYFAMSINTTVDYFVTADYTKFTSLRYFDGDVTDIVTEPDLISFVSKYLLLSKQSQDQFARNFLVSVWN